MTFDPGAFGRSFEGTWIGGALDWLASNVPLLVGLGVLGLVVYFVWSFGLEVAKGSGQVGIIEGYVGTIGAGKTTLAVQHAFVLARARNAVLLSNIPVRCGKRCGGPMAWVTDAEPSEVREQRPSDDGGTVEVVISRCLVRPVAAAGCVFAHRALPLGEEGIDLGTLTVWAFRLRDLERGLVLLMDEVGVIMPARLWKDFSVALMWVLQQSRKLACEWIWTAQDPSFVDHQLRSLTAAVHFVRSYPPPSVWRRVKGKRPWFMIASAYTPSQAPRANGEQSAGNAHKRIARRLVRYKRSFEACFDTDGIVLPSKHLKGAEVLIRAVEGAGDGHVIAAGANTWGPHAQGAEEPTA